MHHQRTAVRDGFAASRLTNGRVLGSSDTAQQPGWGGVDMSEFWRRASYIPGAGSSMVREWTALIRRRDTSLQQGFTVDRNPRSFQPQRYARAVRLRC